MSRGCTAVRGCATVAHQRAAVQVITADLCRAAEGDAEDTGQAIQCECFAPERSAKRDAKRSIVSALTGSRR
jgi:hypothetical protein